MHAALQQVLGEHVTERLTGKTINTCVLTSHFEAMTPAQIREVEAWSTPKSA